MDWNRLRWASLRVMPRRAITRWAMAKNSVRFTLSNPDVPPLRNDGMKTLGMPSLTMLQPTPTTVAVLNDVLIALLEWSPIMRPQN